MNHNPSLPRHNGRARYYPHLSPQPAGSPLSHLSEKLYINNSPCPRHWHSLASNRPCDSDPNHPDREQGSSDLICDELCAWYFKTAIFDPWRISITILLHTKLYAQIVTVAFDVYLDRAKILMAKWKLTHCVKYKSIHRNICSNLQNCIKSLSSGAGFVNLHPELCISFCQRSCKFTRLLITMAVFRFKITIFKT